MIFGDHLRRPNKCSLHVDERLLLHRHLCLGSLRVWGVFRGVFVINCNFCSAFLSTFVYYCVCKTVAYDLLGRGSWLVVKISFTVHSHFSTICSLRRSNNFYSVSDVVGEYVTIVLRRAEIEFIGICFTWCTCCCCSCH